MRWLILLFACGCATTGSPSAQRTGPRSIPQAHGEPAPAPTLPVDARMKVLAMARAFLADARRTPPDCSSLVVRSYGPLRVALGQDAQRGDNAVTMLYRYVSRRGTIFSNRPPAPGDMVFFRDSYDLNHDRLVNDGLTHVGIVDGLLPDGTILFIHRGSRGVVREHLNVGHPRQAIGPGGQVWNDVLRGRGPGAKLTSELFVAFGSIFGPS